MDKIQFDIDDRHINHECIINGDNKYKLAYLIKKDVIKRNALKVDKY